MAIRTWHPYAPDQAFGHQAAADEELVDQILARLDGQRRAAPRAGNKAAATASPTDRWNPTSNQLRWLVADQAEAPVTTASALDAAPLVRQTAP